MTETTLTRIQVLKDTGDFIAARALAVQLASQQPQDVRALMAAAYACDRLGYEAEAVVYYDRAWAVGVPGDQRVGFLVGYGSTLRNVGRVPDSIQRLQEGLADYPQSTALRAFLALALHSNGQPSAAMASLLYAALRAASEDGFEGYDRALRSYADELARDAESERV